MSIESEIMRIQKNIADTYAAVADMGGTVPASPTSASLAAAVRSIPAGSGGSEPVGTVISYMGATAPAGYLSCDGAVKNIGDYPALARHFETQLGSANYFGGDGTTTFALPDMRNLFLRGYHGSAAALSGNIGKKQEATDHLYSAGTTTSHNFPASDNAGRWEPKNYDSRKAAPYRGVYFTDAWDGTYNNGYLSYTARPVNMAVLYCIKAG
jgi:microcystin-dependent protein